MEIPEEFELISVFECVPTLLDEGVPFVYNSATYKFINGNNESFEVTLDPAYGDFRMDVTIQDSPKLIAELDFKGMSSLEILEDSRNVTKIAIESDTLQVIIQMKPCFSVLVQQHNYP